MRITKIFFLLLGLFIFINAEAQDRHFTLFNLAPLVINPAYTGSYEGSVRVGGLIREQSPFIAASNRRVYSTQNIFGDAPLLNVRKRDWVGVGVNIYSDKAGTFGLGWQTFHASVAYHLSLDSRRNSVLTLGIQGGTIGRSVGKIRGNGDVWADATRVGESSELDGMNPFTNAGSGMGGVPGGMNNDDPSANFFDLGAGMLLKSKINRSTNIELGFSLQHITGNFMLGDSLKTSSNYSLNVPGSNDRNYRIPKTFILHGTYNVELTNVWSLSPSFLFQQARNQNEAVLQFLGGYKLMKREVRDDGRKGKLIKNDDAPKIRFGLGYRLGDAMQVLLGYEVGNLRVGLGYDLTLSTLSDANGGNGAFELAANYIFKIYKRPDVDPTILCPKF